MHGLQHSYLFRVSPRMAWAIVVAMLALVASIEANSSPAMWFGPIYLAIMAFAAWSLNSLVAVAIGLGILGARLATGELAVAASTGPAGTPNLAVRVLGIMIVVLVIGAARKACEREWRAARIDSLTGAWNRSAFFEILRKNQHRGGWHALIYADLDGLKRVNDEEGHAQGDENLKVFAETVRKTIRKGDVFARMGGDEFVIFMKLKDKDAGTAVANRLDTALNTEFGESRFHLSCSLGILLLPEGSTSIDGELRAADELMYMAKKSRSGVLVSTACESGGRIEFSPCSIAKEVPRDDTVVRQADRAPTSEPCMTPDTHAVA
ncbi:GGDEF domain-containing protein [Novosphingobium sp. KN65.2]|uniref:GGDEF domain-containing protein n=1 Tax=Novosphingobium sp. KN65.2 TaxID=1478134 RepID=UPI0005DEB7C2|nr:GGDEF domain-containing protein [Novosphingobium sp. KN65.2]CDO34370.1 putative Diguanylate kinase [Novosphingobium sp. KN65.2]